MIRMVKLNRMTILKELEGYPVFTGKALQDITGKGKEYSNLLIYRLVHAGLIYKLEKINTHCIKTHSLWHHVLYGLLIFPVGQRFSTII